MLPTAGLTLHVTAWFVLPAIAALNWLCCDGLSVTLPGVIDIVTGSLSCTVAVAIFEMSATLVAVTRTVCGVVIVAGAVYTPLDEMLPKMGLIFQVTALFVLPVTDALKVCVCEGVRPTVSAAIEILTGGTSEIWPLAVFAGSAMLVAVTVTVCAVVRLAGAV